MKTYNVAIVGGGPSCLVIIDIISKDRLRQLKMHIVGIADTNPEAPGIRRSRELNIYTTDDYHNLFTIPDLDLIIELTGKKALAQMIQREKPPHVQVMDHHMAQLFWEIVRLDDERLRAEKAAEDGETPEDLVRRVATPGGTTEAAFNVFTEGKFGPMVNAAIKRACQRSRELSHG